MEDRNRHSSTASWTPVIAVGTVLIVAAVLVLATQFLQVRSVRHAPQTTCSNNLHQLGLCFASYRSDHGDRFPEPDKWPKQIVLYCKSADICTCPHAPHGSGMKLRLQGCDRDVRVTYSMNSRLKGLARRDVTGLAQTVLLFDSTGAKLAGGPELLPTEVRHDQKDMGMNPCPMINVLFADGHVKQVPLDEVNMLKWDPK